VTLNRFALFLDAHLFCDRRFFCAPLSAFVIGERAMAKASLLDQLRRAIDEERQAELAESQTQIRSLSVKTLQRAGLVRVTAHPTTPITPHS
jgi:hypothetical protein